MNLRAFIGLPSNQEGSQGYKTLKTYPFDMVMNETKEVVLKQSTVPTNWNHMSILELLYNEPWLSGGAIIALSIIKRFTSVTSNKHL